MSETCIVEAFEQCPALELPDAGNLIPTMGSWGAAYKLCQLKHNILIECAEDAEK